MFWVRVKCLFLSPCEGTIDILIEIIPLIHTPRSLPHIWWNMFDREKGKTTLSYVSTLPRVTIGKLFTLSHSIFATVSLLSVDIYSFTFSFCFCLIFLYSLSFCLYIHPTLVRKALQTLLLFSSVSLSWWASDLI